MVPKDSQNEKKPPAREEEPIQVTNNLTTVIDPKAAGDLFERILRAVRREEERLRKEEQKADDAA